MEKKIMTQKEFDTQMSELNAQQYAERRPLELKREERYNEINHLRTEIARLNAEIDTHRSAVAHINGLIKDVNIRYHAKKHELIIANPKSETISA